MIEEVKLLMSETQETKAVIEEVTAEQTAVASDAVDRVRFITTDLHLLLIIFIILLYKAASLRLPLDFVSA